MVTWAQGTFCPTIMFLEVGFAQSLDFWQCVNIDRNLQNLMTKKTVKI